MNLMNLQLIKEILTVAAVVAFGILVIATLLSWTLPPFVLSILAFMVAIGLFALIAQILAKILDEILSSLT